MFRRALAAILAVLIAAVFSTADARDTYVRGYVRKDGTYVQPHYRSAPDRNSYNNYSTRGNINPYTGKVGTKDPVPSGSYLAAPPAYGATLPAPALSPTNTSKPPPQSNMTNAAPCVLASNGIPQIASLATKARLGIQGGTVTRNESGPSIYLPDPYGAWIDEVNIGGPAAQAGLKRADIVRTFNGHRVETFEELEAYWDEIAAGRKVSLGVWRNRQLITLELNQ